jgi:hypothetical protein
LFVWYVRTRSCVFSAVRLRMCVCWSFFANAKCSDCAGTSRNSTRTHMAARMRPAMHNICSFMHSERFLGHRSLSGRSCGEQQTGRMQDACSTRLTLRPHCTFQNDARAFFMYHTTYVSYMTPCNLVQRCYRAMALLSGRCKTSSVRASEETHVGARMTPSMRNICIEAHSGRFVEHRSLYLQSFGETNTSPIQHVCSNWTTLRPHRWSRKAARGL